MKKEQKIKLINEAILRSEVATSLNMKAELIDGKIVYSQDAKSSTSIYSIRIKFSQILYKLQGNDIRELKLKYRF